MTADGARRVLLVGGSSEIGLAIVRELARRGPISPTLLGRDEGRLETARAQLEAAGSVPARSVVVDADAVEQHREAIGSAFASAGGFELVVLAVGVLGAQAGLDANDREALEVMRVNLVGAGSLLLHCLRALRAQGSGTMIVLSSAAVERPRAANPIYGPAKAGLDAMAQGLADTLEGSGVRVLVVRPGFVSTKMTAGLKAPPFSTTPEAVARATVEALGRRAHTIWVPAPLRWIFAFLRLVPRPIFRRLPL